MRLHLNFILAAMVLGAASYALWYQSGSKDHPSFAKVTAAPVRNKIQTAVPIKVAINPQKTEREALLWIDHVRKIPGAAELLDEILSSLKVKGDSVVSLENIPRDATGSFALNDDLYKSMISDPVIRKKWLQLMGLIVRSAQLPERD